MSLVLLMVLCVFSSALAASPTSLIEAEEGHDVVLQCSPNPGSDLSKSSWTWSKDKQKNIVHAFTDGQDRPHEQMEEFRNRTSLDHEGLRKGNVSLRLSFLRLSDSGVYIFHGPMLDTPCYFNLTVVKPGQLLKPQEISPNTTTKAETPDGENGTGYVKYIILIVCVLRAMILILGAFMTFKKIKKKMDKNKAAKAINPEMQTLNGGHQTNGAGNVQEFV